MRKIIFTAVIALIMSVFGLQAQSWTANSSNLYVNPTTTKVGIGTPSPSQALSVKGRVSISPANTTPDEGYNGDLVITKPAASGQYINLIRQSNHPWSIGTVYNSNTFAIGNGRSTDSQFTDPFFTINTNGNVGIGTITPTAKLDIATENGNAIRIGKIGHTGNLNVPVGGLAAQYNIDFTGYRDMQPDQIGARIAALRFNSHHPNSALIQETGLAFYTNPYGTNGGIADLHERMRIEPNGNIGIGITKPTAKLDVAGTIRAHEVKVCVNQGCDYVFEADYNLMSLSDLSNFIKTNKHLPEIAPAAQMESEGINLSDMNMLLLKKVEELTLYVIGQQQEINSLKEIILQK